MGSDLLHGAPILDIKPYIQYSDAVPDASSGYARMNLSKPVIWTETAQIQQQQLLKQAILNKKVFDELEQVLSLDPRPAIRRCERVYGMCFADLNVRF